MQEATRESVITSARKEFGGKVALKVIVDPRDDRHGSVGFALLNGDGDTAPKDDAAYAWVDKETWVRMREWMLGVRRGAHLDPPPARPSLVPFRIAPWYLRLLGIGGTVPKAQVPKGYRK